MASQLNLSSRKAADHSKKARIFSSDSQCNVRVMYSLLSGLNATTALTRWEWIGEAVTIDSWAWVHCIHFFFGLQMIYSVSVLTQVTYQKIHSGKIWIGDSFASLSTSGLVLRAIIVVISWALDSFWALNEYTMSRASILTGSQPVLVHRELVHADIMVIFLGLVGLVSSIFRERIDPSVAIVWFEFVHQYRLSFLRSAPALIDKIASYSRIRHFSLHRSFPQRIW
ncbi:hypothetical protein V7S43_007723 [Phytophthora oleae]|uniref:Transmembrane protein n=1 Tax=Phytophthora oleae TaxID=2107226 RepID=A0ABD3FKS2_9STRA